MIVKSVDSDHLEIEIPITRVYVSKQNAFHNFERFLEDLRKEFQQEFTRTTFPALNIPPTTHHLIVND